MRNRVALREQTQLLILMLGCFGFTGTALALALTLAHKIGRSVSGA